MHWNHNIAFHPLILAQVPRGCEHALDVGCGDGLLARKLSETSQRVTGVDVSAEMIAEARAAGGAPAYLQADFMTGDLPERSYDFVCTVATLHHLPFAPALTKMAGLLRPGGRLVVIGLGRNATPGDWVIDAGSVIKHQIVSRMYGGAVQTAPTAEPTMTWSQVRRQALTLLPGARWRRHLLWRYSLVWTKP
ncbi:class I SAM-dependent methyltransferase [Nonomuraea typhae]|uniref:class I SAM-dependent methyltransferase n=1 Tax=Nonomuraea typhae TaxID=2603600 RepID=UPI001FEAFFD4|nr:class I SAM-dependent methyltransferase [Nonomuraea typhae]